MRQFVQDLRYWRYRQLASMLLVCIVFLSGIWTTCAIIGYAIGWIISWLL